MLPHWASPFPIQHHGDVTRRSGSDFGEVDSTSFPCLLRDHAGDGILGEPADPCGRYAKARQPDREAFRPVSPGTSPNSFVSLSMM